jgi:hypothetical protein
MLEMVGGDPKNKGLFPCGSGTGGKPVLIHLREDGTDHCATVSSPSLVFVLSFSVALSLTVHFCSLYFFRLSPFFFISVEYVFFFLHVT